MRRKRDRRDADARAFDLDDNSDNEDNRLIRHNDSRGYAANRNWISTTTIIIKFLSYPVVFLIFLGGSVIAKGTILLMTSQLRANGTILHCNRLLHRDKTFVVTVPEEEKIAWVWCLIFAFAAPEALTLIQSLIGLFMSSKLPDIKYFILVFVMETFHVVGLAMLFISVLPDLDVIRGAMLTSCVCFVPGLLVLLSRSFDSTQNKYKWNRLIFILVDIVALIAQATAFIFWPLIDSSNPSLWFIPVALILTSCGWWENYVSVQSPLSLIRSLAQVKKKMRSAKNVTYIVVSIWKVTVFLLSAMLILHLKGNDGFWYPFEMFNSAFSDHNITVTEVESTIGGGTIPDLSNVVPTGMTATIITNSTTPIYVLVIQILSAYFAFVSGKFACKTLIQGFSYALPVNFTIPVLISLLIATCDLRNRDPCFFHGSIPDYLFYNSPSLSVFSDFIIAESNWVWLLWLFSQTWITFHICTPKSQSKETTEKIFMTPNYNGLLIDQSMGMNRKRDDEPSEDAKRRTKPVDDKDDEAILEDPSPSTIPNSDLLPKIYACATMWHENKEEMSGLLESILRLDNNQCIEKSTQECLDVSDPDLYELETHIFIDDAFKKYKRKKASESEVLVMVNTYVKTFIELMDEVAIRETRIVMKPMTMYPTPYGGRLVWTLPGGTLMHVHLKDSDRIRHKKRWSQVMYMYYLLHHRFQDLKISKNRKKVITENTFLLALDGDIVFQPSAVKLLVDLMKKDTSLGAACGRIHPMGSGPMAWYQMFEYAIGHWLQKATEHMIGCVLCSPGCFSLFRAKALMKASVMTTYTTKSTEAKHYVQYDQGEDRWLCTLLLKRGYRVEYSAASDSYTHVPISFFVFCNQRRRWLPSTMANILDLLVDYRRVVKQNKKISRIYMLYQLFLMAGTILGPGTIFLMLIGACVAAFKIGLWESFTYNIIPILIFLVVCFVFTSTIQLYIAAVISMMYGLVMMAVIVGIFMQIFEDSWLAPSSIFLSMVVCQFVITGIMHPQELNCLPYGIIYFVSIPSMYLLLPIYALANLNDVTWGTRVEEPEETLEETEEEEQEAEEDNKNFGFKRNDEGLMEFSIAGLFKCILCSNDRSDDDEQTKKLLEQQKKQSVNPEEKISGQEPGSSREFHSARYPRRQNSDSESSVDQDNEENQDRDSQTNPYWMEDEALEGVEVNYISTTEQRFWKAVIKIYLSPIKENKKQQKKVAADLKDLRDKVFISFFMLNSLFVTIIFLMQLNQDVMHIKWPLNSQTNITYDGSSLEVHIGKEYLQLEPIGLVFVALFGVIIVMQFTGMLFHRFGTFTHILANTSLEECGCCWKKAPSKSRKSFLATISQDIIEELERPANTKIMQQRNLNNSRSGRDQTLGEVYRQRIFSMSDGSGLPRHVSPRKSQQIHQVLKRSESVKTQRRLSQTRINGTNNLHRVIRVPLGQPGPSTSTLNSITEVSENYRTGITNHAFAIEEPPSKAS